MKAKEILAKYPHQHTPKDVEAARVWLEEVRAYGANGVYASFYKGQMQSQILNGPCHGGIASVARRGPLIASLTKGLHNSGYGGTNTHIVKADPEMAERWFTWLLYDTYWSPFYVDTTVDQAMHSGLLVPSTLPANLMQGCNILTRHNHEHPNSIRAWDALIRAGMEPDVAYLVVFCWGLTLQSFKQNMPISFMSVGHSAMAHLAPSVLRNFLAREYNNLVPPIFSRGGAYGLSSMLPYDQGQGQIQWYGGYSFSIPPPKHIKELVKFLHSFDKKVKTSSVVSPFAKRTTQNYGLIGGMERPGAKIILDNAKDVQEYLLKEFIND